LTLYVESNFVLEVVLGQEELAPAERLLATAEAGAIELVLPEFSLGEPFARVKQGIRDRRGLMTQLNTRVGQLARSSPHQTEVGALQAVPNLVASIDRRERDRLTRTIERLLGTARFIALDLASYRAAITYQTQYDLEIEDAIILATVIADLQTQQSTGRHLFANRNQSDFDDPGIVADLGNLGCDLVWTFADAVTLLGMR
jgi:predicted nucleic acid-binding protein